MFCTNCGQKVSDSAHFCTSCGAPLTPVSGTSPFALSGDTASQYSGDSGSAQAYVQPKPTVNLLRVLLSVVCGAALLFVCIFGISRLLMTPKNTVALAAGRTAKAYTEAAKSVSAFDAQKLLADKAFSQELTIRGINDLTDGEYTFDGFRLRTDVSLPDRYIDLSGSVLDQRGAMLTARAAIDDDLLAANIPELLGGDFWAVHTQTLGSDLASSVFGLQASDYADVSFNLFDLLDEAVPANTFGDAAGKALWDAVTAEKAGKQELSFGGESHSCMSYRIFVPQSALEDYVNNYFDYLDSLSGGSLQDALADSGFPVKPTSAYARDAFSASASASPASPFDSARESILNALNTIGDLDFIVYTSGGYLCGLDWSPADDDYSSNMHLSIRMGGKNHTNYFSLSLENYGSEIYLESTGNHSAKGGTFTDSTRLESDGELVLSWECSYAPKSSGNNFRASLYVPDAYPALTLSLDGRIESDSRTLNVDLENISVDSGYTHSSMSCSYVLSSFEKAFEIGTPVMILKLDQNELMELVQGITDNLQSYEELIDELFG